MKEIFSSPHRLISTAIKVVVSGFLIYWVLRESDVSQIMIILQSTNIRLLSLAFIVTLVITYLRAYRWQGLLRTTGVNASLRFLFQSSMVSFFFSSFLPSTIGGDTVRAYDAWRVGTSKTGAVAVVLVDRFLGIVALMFFVMATLPASKKLTANLPFLYPGAVLGAALMLLIVWIIFFPSPFKSVLTARVRFPLPRKLQDLLDTVINAFLAFQGNTDALVRAMTVSLFLQAFTVIHFYMIAKALDFPVSIHMFFLIIPLAIFIMMLPMSINAIGVRESVFVFFFANFGISNAEAIAFAWLVYGIVILNALLGGIVYALRQ